jgi:hypothetical protein
MKNLADRAGHIINAASPFFGREQPERRVALWIEVNDQDPFVMIRSQTSTDMDGIRGLADASFEIDKRDYLAHLAFVGFTPRPSTKQIQYLGTRKKSGAGNAA